MRPEPARRPDGRRRGFPRIRIVGVLLVPLVVACDQVTKAWALAGWFSPPRVVEVTAFLNLVPVWNTGVAFGFLAGDWPAMPLVLTGFSAAVSLGLAVWLLRSRQRAVVFGLGLIVGGAVGNIVDRLRFGAVIDFVDLHVAGLHWPAFNIADAGITLGVGLLLLDGVRTPSGRYG